ncbi:MAG: hypothetical protein HQ500_05455 [Flavobacteriales bacterium]|nr:hypothetical protein [Flavobacteriales bacterium]
MKHIIQSFSLLLLFSSSLRLGAQETFIYVSDAGNWNNPPWQILKYDIEGNFEGVFIDQEMAWPQDILFLDSTVLISNLNSGKINAHDIYSGDFIESFATDIAGPTRMKIGSDSLLYVLQWSGDGKVKRYDQEGNFVDDFTSIGINQGIGLDWDAQGNLYVSSYGQDHVQRFDTNGVWIDTFIDSALVGPTNIWFAEDGTLFVSDYDGGSIQHFDANGAFLSSHIGGLNQAEGVDFMENGDLLIGNGGTGAVKQFSADGTFIGDLIPSSLGGLLRPNAVVLHDEHIDTLLHTLPLAKPSARIFPTNGNQFSIDGRHQYIERIQVWDANGKLFEEHTSPSSAIVWNAQEATTGVYFIVIEMADGEVIRHRVLRE